MLLSLNTLIVREKALGVNNGKRDAPKLNRPKDVVVSASLKHKML